MARRGRRPGGRAARPAEEARLRRRPRRPLPPLGWAPFPLGGQEHEAPAGTLVHCPPGTLREAVAAEAGTTVLGIGAKPGEVFQPSGWEWVFAGISLLEQGDEAGARRELQAGIE